MMLCIRAWIKSISAIALIDLYLRNETGIKYGLHEAIHSSYSPVKPVRLEALSDK